jgi:hypothetical protein
LKAPVVGKTVQDGEEDGERFLHSEQAAEGPFAVELFDWEARGDAGGGYEALAGVVAFLGAGPEEKAEVEGNEGGRGGEAVGRYAVL